MPKSVGEKIKIRRSELGWTLRELADRMGYANHSTVARIESGKVDIPQSKVVKFAEVMNTSIAFLMDWEEDKKQSTQDELSERKRLFMQKVEEMSDDQLERLEQILALVENTDA